MGACLGKGDAAAKANPEVRHMVEAIRLRLGWSDEDLSGLRLTLTNLERDNSNFSNVSLMINRMSKLALRLPADDGGTFRISAREFAIFLAQALLCVIGKDGDVRGQYLPDFCGLYRNMDASTIKQEKFKCLWHYFSRISVRPPEEDRVISFALREISMNNLERIQASFWGSEKPLSALNCVNQRIEDADAEYLHVLPAETKIGHRFLSDGGTEDDIRIAICPEILAARLMGIELSYGQCLLIKGAERFSFHTGLDRKILEFRGQYNDRLADLRHRVVVAVDAADFSDDPVRQFEIPRILEELSRAFIAFLVNPWENPRNPEVLATTHWGCDPHLAGDRQLRAVLQLLAASQNLRPMQFCSIADLPFLQKFENVHKLMVRKQMTVKDAMRMLHRFSERPDKHLLFDKLFDVIKAELE